MVVKNAVPNDGFKLMQVSLDFLTFAPRASHVSPLVIKKIKVKKFSTK